MGSKGDISDQEDEINNHGNQQQQEEGPEMSRSCQKFRLESSDNGRQWEYNQSQRNKNEHGDHLKPIADVLYWFAEHPITRFNHAQDIGNVGIPLKVVAEDRVTNRSCSATNLNNCGKKCHASMWPGPSLRPNCLGRAPSYPSNLPAASRGGDGSNLGPEVRESHDWSTKYQQLRWYTNIYIYHESWIIMVSTISAIILSVFLWLIPRMSSIVRGPFNTLWVSKK